MWFVIKGDVGYCGTDTYYRVEADNEDDAVNEVYEILAANITAGVLVSGETEDEINEEAEDYGC